MVEALCKKSGEVAGHGTICLCKSGFGDKSSPPTLPSSAISKFCVMSSFRYRSFGSCKSWSFLDSRSPGLFELRDVCIQSTETLDQNSGRQGFCFLLPSFHGMEGVSKRQDSGRNRPGPERQVWVTAGWPCAHQLLQSWFPLCCMWSNIHQKCLFVVVCFRLWKHCMFKNLFFQICLVYGRCWTLAEPKRCVSGKISITTFSVSLPSYTRSHMQ